MNKETVAYILEVLFDDLGLTDEEALDVLADVVREIARSSSRDSRVLEDFANSLV